MSNIPYYPNDQIALPPEWKKNTASCPSCEKDRPDPIGIASFVAGSVCPNCGHVETDDLSDEDTPEREPLQYHYVVWAEIRDGEIEWHVDIEGNSLLGDGSVYDPNAEPNDGWRTLDDSEEDLDNLLYDSLRKKLGITY